MADIEMTQRIPEITSPSKSISNQKCRNKFLDTMTKHLLLITTLLGVVVAIILGVSLRPQHLSKDTILLISYPGELFLRMLKLMTLPLLISSIVTVSSNLHAGVSGKMVFRALMYFVSTTILAILIGFTIALTFEPGTVEFNQIPDQLKHKKDGRFLDSLLDLGRNLFPENIFQATFQQAQTIFVETNKSINGTSATITERQLTYQSGPNTMGLVVFCLLFGFGVNRIGDRGETIKLFFAGVFDVLLSITTRFMWLSGIGVCSIIAAKMLEIEDLPEVLSQLAVFMFCVILGIFIHQLIMMPAIYFIFVRKNPYTFYISLMDPWVTAFAVCSSVVTLPTTLHCMIEKLKADERVARFVLTLGVPLNLDGTALFLSIASIFVARLNGVDVNVSTLIVILITTTAVSMAMPSVPSSSLVALLIVLSAIDVDPKDVSLLFAVDWILDRFRTTSNVLGDCFAAAVIEKVSQKELRMVQSPDAVANEAYTDDAHFLQKV